MSPPRLVPTPAGLALEGDLPTGRARLVVDLARGAWRRRITDARRTDIVRAAGRPGAGIVVDCTAGFLRDALALASAGFRVVACERDPTLFALIDDALRRARDDATLGSVLARIALRHADAVDALDALDAPPDVVVIDPMFDEEAKGGAAVGKEMQLARLLLAPSPDEGRVLVARAKAKGARRIIVKRPRGAPPLVDGVSHHRDTRAARLDVYVRAEER